MVVSDRDRRDLYLALQQQLGEGPADTMMEMLPPVGWSDVARKSDIESLRVELKAEMKAYFAKTVYTDVGLVFATAGLVLAAARLT